MCMSAELLKLERARISSNPLLPSSRHLRHLLQSPPILPTSRHPGLQIQASRISNLNIRGIRSAAAGVFRAAQAATGAKHSGP